MCLLLSEVGKNRSGTIPSKHPIATPIARPMLIAHVVERDAYCRGSKSGFGIPNLIGYQNLKFLNVT